MKNKNKMEKLPLLAMDAFLETSVYMFEKIKEIDWNITKNKPVKFNPDELNRNYKVIPKNHKRFIIEGIEIYALSEKRAIEKFKLK
jgi:hypothetical protein